MTHQDFILLINVVFAIGLALAAFIGYRIGSAWQ